MSTQKFYILEKKYKQDFSVFPYLYSSLDGTETLKHVMYIIKYIVYNTVTRSQRVKLIPTDISSQASSFCRLGDFTEEFSKWKMFEIGKSNFGKRNCIYR